MLSMPKSPSLNQEAKNKESAMVRVSLSEAARLFGINPRTIRRAMAVGELRYIVVRGRYQLLFESLVHWSQQKTTVRNKRDHRDIGQWVEQWKIRNPKFSPRPPHEHG